MILEKKPKSEFQEIGATAQFSAPVPVSRDLSNVSVELIGKKKSNAQFVQEQYARILGVRSTFLDALDTVNPGGLVEYFKGILRTKPEAALTFLGKLLPRDMDIPTEQQQRQPIVIIAPNSNVQVNMG